MATKSSKSIEEKVEDHFKEQLRKLGISYKTKTESINPTIDKALKEAPSKSGKGGATIPILNYF